MTICQHMSSEILMILGRLSRHIINTEKFMMCFFISKIRYGIKPYQHALRLNQRGETTLGKVYKLGYERNSC